MSCLAGQSDMHSAAARREGGDGGSLVSGSKDGKVWPWDGLWHLHTISTSAFSANPSSCAWEDRLEWN